MAWRVTVDRSFDAATASRWQLFFDAPQYSPFQTERWLKRWYSVFGARAEIEPLLVSVQRDDGIAAVALPLILRKERLRTIEFADLGITDYNAPLLGPASPTSEAEARSMWQAIRAALPPADLLVLEKMPPQIGAVANPLALALRTQPSSLFGSYIRIDTDWEGWLRSLDRGFRKELGRSWRVFTRDDERARFDVVSTPDEALTIYRLLEAQQSARIHELGLPYRLDDPDCSRFYRELILDGLEDGSVVLSALTCGEELVGCLLGIRRGDHFGMIRTSSALGTWSNSSPGRLVIERTMATLFDQGVRTFDFTIGDYPYKRAFQASQAPLVEIRQGLSWRAWPVVGYEGAKAYVKQRPGLEKLIRKVARRAA